MSKRTTTMAAGSGTTHLPSHVLRAFPIRTADAAPPAGHGLDAEEGGGRQLLQQQLRPLFPARELLVSW